MPKSIELDKKKFFLQLFDLFEKELLTIFEYIAPIENNYHISGNRIHDLHLRICSKIENLAKFLCLDIDENFGKQEDKTEKILEILDKKISLRKKKIQFIGTIELGKNLFYNPFGEKQWRDSYNLLKHGILDGYSQCCLKDVINAFGGYYILLNYLILGYDSLRPCNDIIEVNFNGLNGINTSIFLPTYIYYSKIPVYIFSSLNKNISSEEEKRVNTFLESAKFTNYHQLEEKECLYCISLCISNRKYWNKDIKTINDLSKMQNYRVLQPKFSFIN